MSTHLPHETRPAAIWTPCGYCGGQRCVFEYRARSVLEKCTCPRCLGIGEVLVDAAWTRQPAPRARGTDGHFLDDAD